MLVNTELGEFVQVEDFPTHTVGVKTELFGYKLAVLEHAKALLVHTA